jgi:hypothetical protein
MIIVRRILTVGAAAIVLRMLITVGTMAIIRRILIAVAILFQDHLLGTTNHLKPGSITMPLLLLGSNNTLGPIFWGHSKCRTQECSRR